MAGLPPLGGQDVRGAPSGGLPGVVAAKDLPHELHPHQVAQQGVDRHHLEEQEGPSHKHQHVAAGEVVQEVLRGVERAGEGGERVRLDCFFLIHSIEIIPKKRRC